MWNPQRELESGKEKNRQHDGSRGEESFASHGFHHDTGGRLTLQAVNFKL